MNAIKAATKLVSRALNSPTTYKLMQ